ncbi:uncharacterized protein ACRADG_006052 [Cochliomyia hominivorax]
MRSIIFALFVAICCMVVYTNAAALPDNSVESGNEVAASSQIIDSNEDQDRSENSNEDNDNGNAVGNQDPQARTLFLLLPLLFPDQFYFS